MTVVLNENKQTVSGQETSLLYVIVLSIKILTGYSNKPKRMNARSLYSSELLRLIQRIK